MCVLDGGGYQYRICPASEPLTEECMQKHPLEFVRTAQQLRWNNGTRLSIPGTWVDKGTSPIGSTWCAPRQPPLSVTMRMSSLCNTHATLITWRAFSHIHRARNPIPRIDFGRGGADDESGSCRGNGRGPNCVNFKPPCDDSWLKVHPKDGAAQAPGDSDDEEGECSGDWTSGTIVDQVLIPKDLKPGDYVVGWYMPALPLCPCTSVLFSLIFDGAIQLRFAQLWGP